MSGGETWQVRWDALFDQAEERERLVIEAAVEEIALHDDCFHQWWDLYRNRHHRHLVAILTDRSGGEGSYYWHFHLVRDLDAEEQQQLLTAMCAALPAALDKAGLVIRGAAYTAWGYPLAYVCFSVAVSPGEVQRRIEARRTKNIAYARYTREMRRTIDAIKAAVAANRPLPTCPFCGTAISVTVKEQPISTGRTSQEATFSCSTPECFGASIPLLTPHEQPASDASSNDSQHDL
jgi:hypothetical protein